MQDPLPTSPHLTDSPADSCITQPKPGRNRFEIQARQSARREERDLARFARTAARTDQRLDVRRVRARHPPEYFVETRSSPTLFGPEEFPDRRGA